MRMGRFGRRPLTVALWILSAEIVGLLLWVSSLMDRG